MPFLSLPKDPAMLRFEDGEVTFHYLLSTPDCQTFVHANANAATFESAPAGSSASRHRKRLSVGSLESKSRSRASSLVQSGGKPKELELDPNYPILFFLPSEGFTCAHLFADQLADPELARRFNLVAVDPRGHGLTKDIPIPNREKKTYDLEIKATDISIFIQRLCNRALNTAYTDGLSPTWDKGIHLFGCSMSGLVAARIAAMWPETIVSVMVTSPVSELESEFMIESFQGVKELIEETWTEVHHGEHTDVRADGVRMPGEVVQGCSYRWAGEESIPRHISSYLNQTWLERLILHKDGISAARDWWFDLFWLRREMSEEARKAITCEMLVVEGDLSPLYDRTVGGDYQALFPNCKSFKHEVIGGAPFLLSVTRPDALRQSILSFLSRFAEPHTASEVTASGGARAANLGPTVDEAIEALNPDERFELIKVYAPGCLPTSDDEDSDYDDSDDSDDELWNPNEESYHQITTAAAAAAGTVSFHEVEDQEKDEGYAPISMVTTVETVLTPDEVELRKQEQARNLVTDLVQNLEIGV
ncbi:hypothetical protein ACQY0O_003377 [Thecaphora frezii]